MHGKQCKSPTTSKHTTITSTYSPTNQSSNSYVIRFECLILHVYENLHTTIIHFTATQPLPVCYVVYLCTKKGRERECLPLLQIFQKHSVPWSFPLEITLNADEKYSSSPIDVFGYTSHTHEQHSNVIRGMTSPYFSLISTREQQTIQVCFMNFTPIHSSIHSSNSGIFLP